MGANKFIDDPSLKVTEDATFKSLDDFTIKFSDDFTFKFFDDGGSIKFADDFTASKAFDDVKQPAYDKPFTDQKLPGTDQFIDPRQIYTNPVSYASAQPFILANPHHSMAWQQTFGAVAQPQADPQTRLAQYEAHFKQIEESKQQLEKQMKDLDEYRKTITEQYNKEKQELNNSKDKKK